MKSPRLPLILSLLLVCACATILPMPTAAQEALVMALGHATGQPGDVVEVGLLVHGPPKEPGDARKLAGLDMTISWQPEIAALIDVRQTSATENWQMAHNASGNRASVSMATLDFVDATPVGMEMLRFQFVLQETVGNSPLLLFDTRAFDIDQLAIEHVTVDGNIESTGVSSGRRSFGALKSRHLPPR